jgi:hypothetical protein
MEPIEKDKKDEKKKPIFSDGPFGKRITMTYDKKVKHNSDYLPDGHLCGTICGRSGSGKSSILLSILPQIANLSQIAICSLIRINKVYDSIREFCDQREIEFIILNDPITAKEEIEGLIERLPEGTNGLIIFDDFSQQKSGRSDPYNQCSASVSALLRNYGYHSFFITQSSTNIPTLFRNNANIRITFALSDQHAIRSVCGDFIANNILKNKDEFNQLYGLIQRTEHSFLMMVTKGDTAHDKLYICLPNKNGHDWVQEVIVNRCSLSDNPIVQKMLNEMKGLNPSSRYDQFRKRAIDRELHNYITYLSKTNKLDVDQLEEELEELFSKE